MKTRGGRGRKLNGPSEEYSVKVELGVKQRMRDGKKLSSDIFRPDAKGRFPVILTRTPYRTVEGRQRTQNQEAAHFAKQGYVYVIQDCRGKNDSEGVFRPFQEDDSRDGYDTISWCAQQDWSNGSVGTTGASYAAWNQWTTATLNPPALKTMVCIVSLPDPVFNVPYQNGAFVLWMAEYMAIYEGRRNTDTSLYDSYNLLWHLPLRTLDEKYGRKHSRIWKDWIGHPSAAYWSRAFYEDKLDRIEMPVLHVSGWYDDDLIGTHKNFVGMTGPSKSQATRENQRLIIGPWQHRVNTSRRLGEIDFGEASLVDLAGVKLAWFDRWLKGVQNGPETGPQVEIFTLGRNAWVRHDRWPPAQTRPTPYYMNSSGRANSSFGDGVLSRDRPRGESLADAYSYDPANPVPNIDELSRGSEGPFDQRPIERRDDVLVYTTPPLVDELELTGPVSVRLFGSTSARDTDFWAQLTDVFPNGYSMHLTEGIIRGRYNKSLERPELLLPGAVYEFSIDLWVISNLFGKGHRIRLDISSSSFPKYDRNPNTGHAFGRDSDLVVAQQKVYHDEDHPSCVVLPILRRSGNPPPRTSRGRNASK